MTPGQAFAIGTVVGGAAAVVLVVTICSLILGGRSERTEPWPQDGDRLQASGGEEYVFLNGKWELVRPGVLVNVPTRRP